MFSEGQAVAATVERVLPFGVFVRLEDGAPAYIRRRELTLAGDIDPRDVVSKGQLINAIVTQVADPTSLMELSLRAVLPDPWPEFSRRFREGDVVTATVRKLLADKVCVQIVPGINGLISLEELATWEVARPEEVLWVGDRVEAMITGLDVLRRSVQLSIRRQLQQLARIEAIVARQQLRQYVPLAVEAGLIGEQSAPVMEEPGEVGLAGPVLVVEDDDAVREPLVRWLCDQGCLAEGAKTASEALEFGQKQSYRLVLTDLALPDMDGLTFIHHLRRTGTGTTVAAMSAPGYIAELLPELEALGVVALPKPLDLEEIRQLLLGRAKGERAALSSATGEQAAPAQLQPFQQLAQVMCSSQPLAERFRQGLRELVREVRAEAGIVFHADAVSGKVSIVAHAGDVRLRDEAVYALVASPVRDVIQERMLVREGRALSEQSARFRKLLGLLAFESCLGVPIHAGEETEHALFLFHRQADAFSHHCLRDALALATLFSAALERHALDESVRSLSRLFLTGHLAAGFGHEVYNKTSGLDLQFHNLRFDLEHLARGGAGLSKSFDLQEVQRALDKALDTAADLKRTVRGFQRLLQIEEERRADVNQTLSQAEALVRPEARRRKVVVRLRLAAGLPQTVGNSIRLQQVFLNLMLNAVQQMESKPSGGRVLEVTTTYRAEDGERPVQVRFSDTGPGIHRRLWERIFALGFTTRQGGSGLGLYIARSLVESVGGRIAVEESLVPLGTTFLVELPALATVKREE